MPGSLLKKIFRLAGTKPAGHKKDGSPAAKPPGEELSRSLDVNLENIRRILGNSEDLLTRVFYLDGGKTRAAAVYIDGLGDDYYIAEMIIEVLMRGKPRDTSYSGRDLVEEVESRLLPAGEVKRVQDINKVLKGVLAGTTVLIIDGCARALIIGTPVQEKGRGVEKPDTESSVRGPREGFTENLKTNSTLVRKRLKDPNLRIKTLTLGTHTVTKLMVVYIEGIVDSGLVDEVMSRLNSIDIDGVIESGYVEQLIEDAPQSFFPTVGNTERPDKTVASLLEGKVAILTDGSPFALIVPWLFWDILKTPEDYYTRPYAASIYRILRLGAVIITMYLPAAYVAMLTHQPEMIPAVLLITIAAAREGIPFPTLVEILLMGLVFETLREAGVRLPRAVGQAVSIVGALVIGDVAVSAGLFSAPGVVVTALAGISSFSVPALIDAYIPIRIISVLMAGFLGVYGLGLVMFFFLVHMCSMRSFGVSYLSPVAPSIYRAWKDIFIRAPLWKMDRRPPGLAKENKRRMGPGMKPSPPTDNKGRGGGNNG